MVQLTRSGATPGVHRPAVLAGRWMTAAPSGIVGRVVASRALTPTSHAIQIEKPAHLRFAATPLVWQSFRETKARARALDWVVEQGLVDDVAARRFTDDHPEPPAVILGT